MPRMIYRVTSTVPSAPEVEIEIAPSVVRIGHQWTAASAVAHVKATCCASGTMHRILRRRADTPWVPWEQFRTYMTDSNGVRPYTVTPGSCSSPSWIGPQVQGRH